MKLFNPSLLKPHNLLVIAGIAIVIHFLATPLYSAIENKGS